jgi:hypothetical protein
MRRAYVLEKRVLIMPWQSEKEPVDMQGLRFYSLHKKNLEGRSTETKTEDGGI